MTDAATRKPIPDPEMFGREIAQHAMAEIRKIGLELAEVGVKERQLESIKRRMVRCIDLAAAAQIMQGVSSAEAQAWAKAAAAALGAEMTRGPVLA